VAPAR